ncbi:SDR family NAD(P)-dependent oxidoreductase [Pseudomonas alliivorans]|uniref:SDR family NAD(P)-dependent oxidoreductase n=1 Tax=Pseudomonas fragariae (ex Marin et al. 2024) TaxID=3080056 RepID=UPI002ED55ABF|nr:SDR family NAD(P)-dependent oxidoreductase [Pseudomonas alliivorans]MEE4703292.1 SDR family NAD(P)-dependent oxidoreductase [Pseudomonas alliivorans]MEE4717529.1 SDR family NAD(P)-dependent oxidoreductase [Pseudomonas alliivorans]MEE4722747.1 SDR family NAD(P)-dependent oxidoreductase [Pseudomonas alliivorans]MEE4739319.1 SDR family NAD(P)-dependent oxidoreductase [Pseudomonas alliivorans]
MVSSPFSLSGKVVMVTGASSGIGSQVAIWLSQQGARVVLVARNTERLEATRLQLHGEGHGVEPFDLLDGAAVPGWMRNLAKAYAPFDGLVHAAGVQMPMPIRALGLDQWETVFATNVTSGFSLVKSFRQKGVFVQGASIVLLSSVMAQAAQPSLMAYCASKGAVESMVRAAALELARDGIRVNAIAPGVVRTEMTRTLEDLVGADSMKAVEQKHPLGFGEPLDIAYAVNYLLSEAARWVTGTSMVVDGGYLAQ